MSDSHKTSRLLSDGVMYRRVLKFFPVSFPLGDTRRLVLNSKPDVNSATDVFLNPFYWRIFDQLKFAPAFVLDCGANCGHFTILMDICIRQKFGAPKTEYALVEGNPLLADIVRKNLENAEVSGRAVLHEGLAGKRTGTASFELNTTWTLGSAVGEKGVTIPYVDLDRIIAGRRMDVLKIDIEGSEWDLFENYPTIFDDVCYLMLELHPREGKDYRATIDGFVTKGFRVIEPTDDNHGCMVALMVHDANIAKRLKA
ncbi:MAG TPA: FkbM family methyltransferase [Candidatus Sumerlaeota bacterium]|nr:FkbM family methyltransferase [Candidatus Sumerlaeota bacterium]